MFCPFCGKQNEDNTLFCNYCGKAITQETIQSAPQTSQIVKKAPKTRISYNVKKAAVTGVLIATLVIVVLLVYYPTIFPWNW